MKIADLLQKVEYQLLKGSLNTTISTITYDSRNVGKNSAFICLRGLYEDGHKYINEAINKGAVAIILEEETEIQEDITIIKVKDTRKALSQLSINYFYDPGKELILIGITGTKGKTTTSWMIKNILESVGKPVGVIGTLGVFIKDEHYETINTTPESYEIQKYLRKMADQKIKYVIMEVSSQALKTGRVEGLTFNYAIFTNLTRDHIGKGEHETMEDYIQSKSLLFQKAQTSIINIDDPHSQDMIKNSKSKIYTYGKNKDSDLIIENIELLKKENFIGLSLTTKNIINDTFLINTPGEFSAYNASAAILTTTILGCKIESIKEALSKVAVKGRVELVPVSNKYNVIIDYAHNGVSMKSILQTIKSYNPKRIVCIFGCGGDRSKTRRYDMGEISGRLSDLTIITEDNSRYEEIENILNDIEIGLKKTNGKYIKIPDRKEAIKYALTNAREGDIILLLGKGHETYKEIKGKRYHFDEREIIKEIINNK